MINSTMKDNRILPSFKHLKWILSLIVILAIWDLIALIIGNGYFMPGVSETAEALIKIVVSGEILKVISVALFRVISGLILGIVSGVIIAALCHRFELVNTLFSPIISIMKATPVACIIVLIWIRLNYTEIAIFVVVLMVLPIVWQNVYEAFETMDKSLIEVANVFKISARERLKILVIPSILSYLLPATVTAIGLAWKAEIAAEIMTNSNIGELIYDFKTVSYDTASIFAWTVIIVTLSILFEKTAKHFLGRLANEFRSY